MARGNVIKICTVHNYADILRIMFAYQGRSVRVKRISRVSPANTLKEEKI